MLRCKSAGSYTDENMMLVPRLQFMCIEVAREAEGLGPAASEAALGEALPRRRAEAPRCCTWEVLHMGGRGWVR